MFIPSASVTSFNVLTGPGDDTFHVTASPTVTFDFTDSDATDADTLNYDADGASLESDIDGTTPIIATGRGDVTHTDVETVTITGVNQDVAEDALDDLEASLQGLADRAAEFEQQGDSAQALPFTSLGLGEVTSPSSVLQRLLDDFVLERDGDSTMKASAIVAFFEGWDVTIADAVLGDIVITTDDVAIVDELAGSELRIRLKFESARATNIDLSESAELHESHLSFDAGTDIELTSGINADLTFVFAGGGSGTSVLTEIDTFSLTADIDDVVAGALKVGSLGTSLTAGSVLLGATADVEFDDPTPVDGLTSTEFGPDPTGVPVTVTGTGTLLATFDFEADPGITGVPTPETITAGGGSIFDYVVGAPIHMTDDLRAFIALTPTQLFQPLLQIANWLDVLGQSSLYGGQLPLVNARVGDILNLGGTLRSGLVDPLSTLDAGVGETVPGDGVTDEVQLVHVSGATGGSFTLGFEGQTTRAIDVAADASTVLARLEELTTIGTGNVTVTGAAGDWTVTFIGDLAATAVEKLAMNSGGLTVDPDFATIQEMLAAVSSLPGTSLTASYDSGTEELLFAVDILGTPDDIGRGFVFDLQVDPLTGVSFVDGVIPSEVAISTETALSFTYGIDLERVEPTILAPIAGSFLAQDGTLSAAAQFTLNLSGVGGVETAVVDVPVAANSSIDDLAADINAALVVAGIDDRIEAEFVQSLGGMTLNLGLVDPGDAVSVDVGGETPSTAQEVAALELGLVDTPAGEEFDLLKSNPVNTTTTGANGELEFDLQIGAATPKTVIVAASGPRPGGIDDLVAAVQASTDAEFPVGDIVVGHDGNLITLELASDLVQFLRITSPEGNAARTEAGFGNGQFAQPLELGPAFVLTDSSSISGSIDLSFTTADSDLSGQFGFVALDLAGTEARGTLTLTTSFAETDAIADDRLSVPNLTNTASGLAVTDPVQSGALVRDAGGDRIEQLAEENFVATGLETQFVFDVPGFIAGENVLDSSNEVGSVAWRTGLVDPLDTATSELGFRNGQSAASALTAESPSTLAGAAEGQLSSDAHFNLQLGSPPNAKSS